jgi:aspartate aminotransferase
VTCHAPDGTFYAFADIRGTGVGDSARFAESLLERSAVAVTPGSAFGPGGEGYVRLSFATSADVLRQVLVRMADFLRTG